MAKFQRVQQGQRQRISPDEWNAITQAARDYYQQNHSPQPSPAPGRSAAKADLALVKNDTGQDLDRWAVLGIAGPLIEPHDNDREFQRRIALRGVLPEPNVHDDRYVVLHEPLRAGAIGRAHLTGALNLRVWATSDTATHVSPGMIEIVDDDEKAIEIPALVTDTSGVGRLLWMQREETHDPAAEPLETPGWRWATIRIGASEPTSFWAMIGNQHITEPIYGWIKAEPDREGGFVPLPGERGENAHEANGRMGVQLGAVVRMFKIGVDEQGEPVYSFHAPQPRQEHFTLPPHDHRDNLQGGGYAFSVYHPGSSLPQLPWAL